MNGHGSSGWLHTVVPCFLLTAQAHAAEFQAPSVRIKAPASQTTNVVSDSESGEWDGDINRAILLLQKNRAAEALELLQDVLAQDPLNIKANFTAGTACIKLGRYREAVSIFERMIEEFPADYFLKNNLAWLYATASELEFRNVSRAIALAQDAILIAPGDYHVWSTLAEAHYAAGNYAKALRAAEEALRLSRQNPLALSNQITYADQVEKCRRAATAMSLIE